MHFTPTARSGPEFAPDGIGRELRKLYYDTANATFAPNMAALMKLVPVSQITYGTDYPYFKLDQIKALRQSGLSDADLQAIESGNAIRLVPRLKGIALRPIPALPRGPAFCCIGYACGRRRPGGVMVPFFVQIKCALGKSYEVANALADAEIASEIYSTAGQFDLLVKFYVDQATDIGHFVNEKVQKIRRHPGHPDHHLLQGVLTGARRPASLPAPPP